jgi:hypothetical protein
VTNFELLSAADVELMQGLGQRIAGIRPEMLNAEATFGELAWNWGTANATEGVRWPRRL